MGRPSGVIPHLCKGGIFQLELFPTEASDVKRVGPRKPPDDPAQMCGEDLCVLPRHRKAPPSHWLRSNTSNPILDSRPVFAPANGGDGALMQERIWPRFGQGRSQGAARPAGGSKQEARPGMTWE